MTDRRLPLDRAALVAACARGERFEYLLFWGHTPKNRGAVGSHVLSQWWPAVFEVGGVRYRSAEQFMMAEKARLFGDLAAVDQILAAPSPAEAKAFGRQVRAFDEQRWEQHCLQIVVRGNVAKFGADPTLLEYLLSTGDRVLVEASPRDRIWGIGMGASNPAATDPAKWHGKNLLGFALMHARSELAQHA